MHNLHVRFFRIAEGRIVKGGQGIVSHILNFTYLAEASFVVTRQILLNEFDKLWFDYVNGDGPLKDFKSTSDTCGSKVPIPTNRRPFLLACHDKSGTFP
jgi:hypothetical protein